MPYPSLYRAKAMSIRSGAVEALVPQVFGETTVTITDALGTLPTAPTMGWVFFQAGNPEFPVWSSGLGTGGGDDGNGDGGGGTGVDEVWIGPGTPPGEQELWFDTDEVVPTPPTPVDSSLKEQTFTFQASAVLTAGAFNGLFLSGVSGDNLVDTIDIARPAGWAGPNPLRSLAFKETGLYQISGEMSTSASVDANLGATYMGAYTRAGVVNPSGLRAFTTPYGPFFHNGVGMFNTMVWATTTDITLIFSAYLNAAVTGLSIWSAPGRLSIIKVRP